MKNLYLFIVALFISAISIAQNGINYKALIKDANGDVIANQAITIQFQILENGTTNVYQETHNPTTDANGIVIVNIGEGTVDSGDFTTLDWGANDHFLNVKVDTGAGLVDLGTTEFKSVPYAMIAEKAKNITGLEAIDEGNGFGWRLKDTPTENYGEIGRRSVDLSESYVASTTFGATGRTAFTTGVFTTASGWYSTAAGVYTKAEARNSFALGSYNVGTGTSNSWVETEPLFEIGNGTSDFDRSNALTVLKNGKVGIGKHTGIEGMLEVESNSNDTQPQLALIEDNSDFSRLRYQNTNRNGDAYWDIAGFIGTNVASDRLNINNSDTGIILSATGDGKVGIGTDNPKGALDISSDDNMGVIMPRVSDLSSVTDGDGNLPVDGTMVFDTSKKKLCVFIDGDWACFGINADGTTGGSNSNQISFSNAETTVLSVDGSIRYLGWDTSINANGTVLAVSSPNIQNHNVTDNGGEVTLFEKINGAWEEVQIISNTSDIHYFGVDLDLDATGNKLVVGALNNVFVYTKINSIWQETQQITTPAGNSDSFGLSVSLSDDGNSFVTSAITCSSDAVGVGGDYTQGNIADRGGVYLYEYDGISFNFETFFGPDTNLQIEYFSWNLALSGDGNTLAVTSPFSQILYVYKKLGGIWSFSSHIIAHNSQHLDWFGSSLAITTNGNRIAVGAQLESSMANRTYGEGENYPTNNVASDTGAVYLFDYSNDNWEQTGFIKSDQNDVDDHFGLTSIAFNNDGTLLAVAAPGEDSGLEGNHVNGSQDNLNIDSGAVYVFQKILDTWVQVNFIKATNAFGDSKKFGGNLYNETYNSYSSSYINDGSCISLDASGKTLIVGIPLSGSYYNKGSVYIIQGE